MRGERAVFRLVERVCFLIELGVFSCVKNAKFAIFVTNVICNP